MKSVYAEEFKRYGKIVEGDYSDVLEYLNNHTDIPASGNIYVADDLKMHDLKSYKSLHKLEYQNNEMQMGYCNGNNSKLNCLEWHKSAEINISDSDIGLYLARVEDLDENNKIDSSEVELFKLDKGTAVMLYPGTMHFSPCKLSDKGFKCAIILNKDVNTELDDRKDNDLMFKKDKCLIAHSESKQATMGAWIGITGKNPELKYRED